MGTKNKTAKAPRTEAPRSMADKPGMVSLLIHNIDPKLRERFRVTCLRNGTTMRNQIITLMETIAKPA